MVEILVVVAILGLLAAIGVPTFRMMKANARSVLCAGKLREIARFTGGPGFVDHKVPGRKRTKAEKKREEEIMEE